MKKYIKDIIKVTTGIIIGLLISINFAQADNLASSSIEHTKTDGTKTTAEAALNEIYSSYHTDSEYTTYGTNQYNAGRASITNNPSTLTLGSTNGTAVDVTAGYYNKVNTTAVYNGGYNAGVAAAQATTWTFSGTMGVSKSCIQTAGSESGCTQIDVRNATSYSFTSSSSIYMFCIKADGTWGGKSAGRRSFSNSDVSDCSVVYLGYQTDSTVTYSITYQAKKLR